MIDIYSQKEKDINKIIEISKLHKIFFHEGLQIKKISEDTTIPASYFHTRPLVGTKDKVFENLDEFKKLGCEYLIAYVADITWGNSLEILKERL